MTHIACTNFAALQKKSKIMILCLPSHTTYVLQPCDVSVFGPLVSAWKSEVNKLTCLGISITKFNLLEHYANAHKWAFKPKTIQSAFWKMGIVPFDCDALDPVVFEASLNSTIRSTQPLAATLPTYIPIEILPTGSNNDENTPTPNINTTETTDQQMKSGTPASNTTTQTNNTTAPAPPTLPPVWFWVIISQPLPHTASQKDLHTHNSDLLDLIQSFWQQIEVDFAQMQLMDLENGWLCQLAFEKERKKAKKGKTDKWESSEACHITLEENLEKLATNSRKRRLGTTTRRLRSRRRGKVPWISRWQQQKRRLMQILKNRRCYGNVRW